LLFFVEGQKAKPGGTKTKWFVLPGKEKPLLPAALHEPEDFSIVACLKLEENKSPLPPSQKDCIGTLMPQ
jgi:hypothetical protein